MRKTKNLKEKFMKMNAWGLWTGIDLHCCNSELIRNKKEIKRFVKELCKEINMKKYGKTTIVNFGKDPCVAGFSVTQLIETSLISAHFANQTNNIFLDIFSCKFYDSVKAAEFTKKFFKAKNYKLNYIIRK